MSELDVIQGFLQRSRTMFKNRNNTNIPIANEAVKKLALPQPALGSKLPFQSHVRSMQQPRQLHTARLQRRLPICCQVLF